MLESFDRRPHKRSGIGSFLERDDDPSTSNRPHSISQESQGNELSFWDRKSSIIQSD